MTIRRLILLLALLTLGVAGSAALRALVPRMRSAEPTPAAAAPPVNQADMQGENAVAVFPSLDPEKITSISIKTPQSAFEFSEYGEEAVSINGQRGDAGVFATLLEHIADMDYVPTTPFPTEQAPLLTLVVHQDDAQYMAAFYDDEATGQHARIAAGPKDAITYGMTAGWRVGTLLMACEGTRIQDESGRETPAE